MPWRSRWHYEKRALTVNVPFSQVVKRVKNQPKQTSFPSQYQHYQALRQKMQFRQSSLQSCQYSAQLDWQCSNEQENEQKMLPHNCILIFRIFRLIVQHPLLSYAASFGIASYFAWHDPVLECDQRRLLRGLRPTLPCRACCQLQ